MAIDREGQGKAAVVVGVLTDQIDPTWSLPETLRCTAGPATEVLDQLGFGEAFDDGNEP